MAVQTWLQKKKEQFKNSFHKVDAHSQTLLDILFQAQIDQEESMNDWDIVDQLITFYFAGMDTTAHMTNMALYHLTTKSSDIRVTVEYDIENHYKMSEEIKIEDLRKMENLDALLKETH